MPLPANCAACTMFPDGKHCLRHAPGPSTRKLEPAKWPQREPTSVCGEGKVDVTPTKCGDCMWRWTPDNKPIGKPVALAPRSNIWSLSDTGWWADAWYCIHHTVGPGSDDQMFYPRVVHALEACGSGETPKEYLKRMERDAG